MHLRSFRPGILVPAVVLLASVIPGALWLTTSRGSPRGAGVLTETALGRACDLQGHPMDPLAHVNGRAVVLLFLGIDCPISNRYAPEIRRLHDEYAPKGVKIWVVYPDADASVGEVVRHQTEYRLPPEVLLDPAHSLVARSQASVTPEAAVFLPDGQLVYHGRIDNRHVTFGSARPEATEHDLRQVLQRIVQGEKVTPATTRAVGCYIPPLK